MTITLSARTGVPQGCQLNFEQFSALVMPSTVTALPTTNLFDGREIYYQIGGTGGDWHLKYNATAGKWDFAGGPPLYSADMPVRALATAGYNPPTGSALAAITIPFVGVYRCRVFAQHQDPAGWGVKTAPRYNGAAADTSLELTTAPGGGNYSANVGAEYELALNAASTFTLEHATADPTAANSLVSRRSISIVPVRIG